MQHSEEKHYRCTVKSPEWIHEVSVRTSSEDKDVIMRLALDRVIEHAEVCGCKLYRSELEAISYRKLQEREENVK